MRHYVVLIALALTISTIGVPGRPAFAHQPFFEEEDITSDAPWPVNDPTVSTAVYATLDSQDDMDYFTFEGQAGQTILLEMTIPQIEGQEEFAPKMALLGPGLPTDGERLPIDVPLGEGGILLEPPSGPAREFFEPFSRTAYWERQSRRVTLPADGRYVVAVWHDEGELGRYVFVIGDKERLGGDPGFATKLETYWTPVPAPAEAPSTLYECHGGF